MSRAAASPSTCRPARAPWRRRPCAQGGTASMIEIYHGRNLGGHEGGDAGGRVSASDRRAQSAAGSTSGRVGPVGLTKSSGCWATWAFSAASSSGPASTSSAVRGVEQRGQARRRGVVARVIQVDRCRSGGSPRSPLVAAARDCPRQRAWRQPQPAARLRCRRACGRDQVLADALRKEGPRQEISRSVARKRMVVLCSRGQPNSSYCGRSSVISCHGALDPTKIWADGVRLGASIRVP